MAKKKASTSGTKMPMVEGGSMPKGGSKPKSGGGGKVKKAKKGC